MCFINHCMFIIETCEMCYDVMQSDMGSTNRFLYLVIVRVVELSKKNSTWQHEDFFFITAHGSLTDM